MGLGFHIGPEMLEVLFIFILGSTTHGLLESKAREYPGINDEVCPVSC